MEVGLDKAGSTRGTDCWWSIIAEADVTGRSDVGNSTYGSCKESKTTLSTRPFVGS